ncbi:hypothetical protein GCM10027068_20600 [Prescottella soli]|uniref:RNA polymerase sigma factor n=1 Tax=Prescottella soli TaxID=1543852 RepID=UPI0038BB1B09
MKPPFEGRATEHGPTVLRVCRVILGVHDAEDALSETFLAAMRAYLDLPGTANVEPHGAVPITMAAGAHPPERQQP